VNGKLFPVWLCKCACGTIRNVPQSRLLTNRTISCGCYRKELQFGRDNIPENGAAKNIIYRVYKNSSAKKRGIEFSLSYDELCQLISNNCHYCGSEPSNLLKFEKYTTPDFAYNGIDRVDNNKGYTIDNCVTCCHLCNWMKKDLSQEEFLSHINKICNNIK
jgi:hypothetical protein